MAAAVAAGVPARRERVDQPRHQVGVRNRVVARAVGGVEERLHGVVQRLAVRQHVPGGRHALVVPDDVTCPGLTVLARERVRVPARVDTVELSERPVVVPREYPGERVRDREVVQQLDASAAEPHVHEALRADRALVADVRRERADGRRVGRDPDAERRAVGGLRANAQ